MNIINTIRKPSPAVLLSKGSKKMIPPQSHSINNFGFSLYSYRSQIKAILLILIYFGMSATTGFANDTDSIKVQKRLKPLVMVASGSYLATMVALDRLWYAGHERESFHFFNDNQEWRQVDKVGHFYSAFHASATGYETLRWAGLSENKALLYGTLSGIISLTSIEVLDGFSSAYGASYGDIIANTGGSLLFYGQKKLWNEIRVHPKFSFKTTPYPALRPEVFGTSFIEQALKDYNGQTYWLSFDLSRFTAGKTPKWLNLAIGYSGKGMVYARDNANLEHGFTPRRQWFLAIDLDINEYRCHSPFLNTLIYIINMIHIPAPALEFRHGKFYFHSLY